MKKLNYLFTLLTLVSLGFFSSCSKSSDPTPAPTITPLAKTGYATSDVTISAGSSKWVGWVANKGGKDLNTFSVTQDGNPYMGYNSGAVKNLSGSSQSTYQDSVQITAPSNGNSTTYKFTVTSSDNQTASFSIKVTASGPVSSYTAKLLGAQTNTAGAYFSSSNGTVYTGSQFAANKSLIDITFAEIGSTTTTPTILSSAQRATEGLTTGIGGNITYFAASSKTSANFDAISNSSDLDYITASSSQMVSVAQNGIYEFVNSNGKKGLIRVTKYDSGTVGDKTDGAITIDVKVQQ